MQEVDDHYARLVEDHRRLGAHREIVANKDMKSSRAIVFGLVGIILVAAILVFAVGRAETVDGIVTASVK